MACEKWIRPYKEMFPLWKDSRNKHAHAHIHLHSSIQLKTRPVAPKCPKNVDGLQGIPGQTLSMSLPHKKTLVPLGLYTGVTQAAFQLLEHYQPP